jgi:hypothetical protein
MYSIGEKHENVTIVSVPYSGPFEQSFLLSTDRPPKLIGAAWLKFYQLKPNTPIISVLKEQNDYSVASVT